MDERRNQHRDFILSEYDPSWVEIFKIKEKVLRSILGDEIVRIHHIGSTSIPGMLAKPQVDLLVEVRDLEAIPKYYGEMETAGFKSMGRKYTRKPDNEYFVVDSADGKRLASIHVYQEGNEEIENLLTFRDYLIENEEARKMYIDMKRDLYVKFRDNYPEYRKGKFEVIEKLKAQAFDWKKSQG